MKKINLKKDFKHYYQASSKAATQVELPTFRFLMMDGKGNPNKSKEYAQAVETLFSASYTAKFMVKKSALEIDYAVMPLEGLWWADDMSDFVNANKTNWKWTMMIMQPEFVSDEVISIAIETLKKKKIFLPFEKLRLEEFNEGLCAQILHIGPFSDEGPTIERLHDFIDKTSRKRGKHHEIYLSDIRRSAPQNWKTIIRQPM
ncbi:MAG TPA: GyrI-like domain-containing protein [Methylotenera sp.]|nr:GyrI-like domain-containing protein [Methylotenera sp.]HPH05080.1 GyrI-like domain-containing protein [Methylotenera sp.]HPN00444.1 GyrI-like domain-containing protein [Methylotenera sp.]